MKKKVVIVQEDFYVGGVRENTEKILSIIQEAKAKYQPDLMVFPELALSGYPPEDLLLRQDFNQEVALALDTVAQNTSGVEILLGHPFQENGKCYNAASWLRDTQCIARYYKQALPNYSVFDEKRYFEPGTESVVVAWQGFTIGILICEDIWCDAPVQKLPNVDCIIVLNASPFDKDKYQKRQALLKKNALKKKCALIYAQMCGAQDELVFDGGSMVVSQEGTLVMQAPFYQSGLFPVALEKKPHAPLALKAKIYQQEESLEWQIYQALVCGLKCYVHKNGFKGVVLGLSGGIDSALSLAIAFDALGKNNVHAVFMPSEYSDPISWVDASEQARLLGVKFTHHPIGPYFEDFKTHLPKLFDGKAELSPLVWQNIQARIRGVLLMAYSNETGLMLLTTGNKSEMAVGYCTLYGDMAGGFSVLKDLTKTWVYRLANYRNTCGKAILPRTLTRAPTAELAPKQKDTDTLPPYEILDEIIALYVEQDLSISEIIEKNFESATVKKVIKMIHQNEYKRRQSPPGVRITHHAFGRDRRYPITSHFDKSF